MAVPKLIAILSELKKEEWTSLKKYLSIKASIDLDVLEVFRFLQNTKLKKIDDYDIIIEKNFSGMSLKLFYNYLSELNLWIEEWPLL